jgi:hypothetical protein
MRTEAENPEGFPALWNAQLEHGGVRTPERKNTLVSRNHGS